MGIMKCPTSSCGLDFPTEASLEGHLREELGYAAFRCGLCPLRFFTLPAAERHFARRTPHPGAPTSIISVPEEEMEDRLDELLAAATSNPKEESSDSTKEMLSGWKKEQEPKLVPPKLPQARAVSPTPDQSIKIAPALPPDVSFGPISEQGDDHMSDVEAHEDSDPTDTSYAQSNVSGDTSIICDGATGQGTLSFLQLAPLGPRSSAVVRTGKSVSMDELKVIPGHSLRCGKCGKDVKARFLHKHVLMAHLNLQVMICKHCPYGERNWEPRTIFRHMRREHGRLAEPHDYFDKRPQVKEEVEAEVEACFGAENERAAVEAPLGQVRGSYRQRRTRRVESRCQICGILVENKSIQNHIATFHLKRPTLVCKLCGYVEPRWYPLNIKHHIRNFHGKEDWESHANDNRPMLMEEFTGLLEAGFGERPPPRDATRDRQCQLCQLPVSNARLRNHVFKNHMNRVRAECRICGAEFRDLYLRHLHQHFEAEHPTVPRKPRAALRPYLRDHLAEHKSELKATERVCFPFTFE